MAHANCLKGRTESDRRISGGGTSCAEARDWACVQGDGSDGRGLSGSAVTVAPHNTCFTRRGASRRWPPRAGWSASVKGGGHAFAAQSVGSRRFVKNGTFAEMGANNKLMYCQRLPPRCGGLRARSRYHQDGVGERISLVQSAHIRQHAFTASALRALPPRASLSVSSERRWTALRRPCGRLSGRRQTQNVS
jgi:hypothetical protein